jgi:GABA(A) receptor-associated protein
MSGDDLVSIVRKHIDATPNTGISRDQLLQIHLGGTKLSSGSMLVSELYRQHSNPDGFLYVAYAPLDETAGSEMRKNTAAKIRAKYPNHLPVICREESALNLFEQGKKKFLIPVAMSSLEFKAVVQSHVDERATELNLPKRSIAVAVAGSPVSMQCMGMQMEEIYALHVSEDGCLYIQCSVDEDCEPAAEVAAESTTNEELAGKVEEEEVRDSNLLDLQSDPMQKEKEMGANILDVQLHLAEEVKEEEANMQDLQDRQERRDLQDLQDLQDLRPDLVGEEKDASVMDLQPDLLEHPSRLPELAAEAGEAQEGSDTCSESGCMAQPEAPQVPPVEPPLPPPPPPPPLMPGPQMEPNAVESPRPSSQAASPQLHCVGSEVLAPPSTSRQSPTDLDSMTAPQGTDLNNASLGGRGSSDCGEATRLRQRYPHRVPVICERAPRADLPDIQKKKFLVPSGMLSSEFKYIIHRQIKQAGGSSLAADQTIYLFVQHSAGSTSPKGGTTMAELYDVYCASDGFLHLSFSAENTLGAGVSNSWCFPTC